MNYEVKPITYEECKEWLLFKHYARRMCSISYSFGLFDGIECIGIVTYGMPPSSTLASSICGTDFKDIVLELNRLVLNDGLPKNSASFLVSSSIKMMPKPKIIVSFADQNQSHNGYIYQACNFIYNGESANTSKLIDKDGNEFHFRNIGHYQKNNKLNVNLVKRRSNESEINKIEIANFLRKYKGDFTSRQLDSYFGYKDTASHWFRTDAGFSFPSVDDWIKLKEILNFTDEFDFLMTKHEYVPDPNEIIKKLELKKVEILPKHRYIYINASKKLKKKLTGLIESKPYPKGENKRYDASFKPNTQTKLF